MSLDGRTLLDTLGSELDKRKRRVEGDWLDHSATEWNVTPQILPWLTLVPTWTAELAVFCQLDQVNPSENLPGVPGATQVEAITEVLDDLVERGLLNAQRMLVILPPEREDGRLHRATVYQMGEAERKGMISYLREKEGQSGVINRLVACARRVLEARSNLALPESLLTWAELAQRVDQPDSLVELIEEIVRRATPLNFGQPLETEADTRKEKSLPAIFATSNLPSPAYNLPPAYFTCRELEPGGLVRREWNAAITQSPFSIGRGLRNLLVLNDERISRNHAHVQWKERSEIGEGENGYYIIDTHSRNGIYVHGTRLTPDRPHHLADGTSLDIGGPAEVYRLTFHLQKLNENQARSEPGQNLPEALFGDDQTTKPFGDDQSTKPFLLNRWVNPWQAGPGDNAETVHLPTLEANLNQALQWLETARRLQEYLDSNARLHLDRASARLQLQFRRWDDLQKLKTFLERREQIEVFEKLLLARDDEWALHYIGPGGYGKTTLIRYLVTRLAPARGRAVARIDFDHLDPRYPRYHPGLLLSELAEELRLQAAQAFTFSGFDQSLISFYEKYPAQEVGFAAGEGRDWLSEPLFKKVLADFASALKEMGGRVLLVLDTCEELTKIRLAGQPAENVSLTFDLLERLHELEPRIRVIFSGRRLLASAGNGWRYLESERRSGESSLNSPDFQPPVSRLAPRPYLALFPVLGFSREESQAYMAAAGLERDFWGPIITKTLAALPPLLEQVEWNDSAGSSLLVALRSTRGRRTARSNPFDLALYSSWIQDDPEVTAQTVAQTDLQRYVETRIVGRARSELSHEFLLAATLLGQFDYALLQATVGADSNQFGSFATFETAFQALGAYEWIEHSSNGWLEIQEPILTRLNQYYQDNGEKGSNTWLRLQNQALKYLQERTLTDARLSGSFQAAEVALRLYTQKDAGEAFDWFSQLNRAAASWDWAQQATERLLGVLLDESPASRLLQARILLLQGAARLHLFRAADLRELWQHTLELVELAGREAPLSPANSYARNPTFSIRLNFVRLMAQAGQAAACFSAGEELPETRWNSFWKLAEQLNPPYQPRETGAMLAAVEAAVEARENEKLSRPLPLEALELLYKNLNKDWLWNDASLQPRMLAAFARSLLGRAMFYEGRTAEGLNQLEQAEEAGRKLNNLAMLPWLTAGKRDERLNLALDLNFTYLWNAPSDFAARLQLEWGRLVRSRLELRLVENHLPLPEKISMPTTLDQDRLIGLELSFSEDLRPAPDKRLPELSSLLAEPPGYSLYAEVNAHRGSLPARVCAAKALAGVGRFGEAISQLDKFINATEERGENFAVSLPETQALVELATAARCGPNPVRRYNELLRSTDLESLRWVWALEGLEGRRQPAVSFWKDPVCLPLHAHYRWRGGYALRRDYALNLIQVYNEMAARARRMSPPRSPIGQLRHEFELYQLKLDDLETQLVLQGLGRTVSLSDPGPPRFTGSAVNEVEAAALRLNHQLLAEVRYKVLTAKSSGEEITVPGKLLERLGERYAGRLLLQDGELLALRLPDKAVPMLGLARSLFQSSRDNDPLSAAYAGICETQALIRANRRERASVVWDDVQRSYEMFRGDWPNLAQALGMPEWKAIERAYTNPADQEIVDYLFDLLEDNWEPWLLRLLFTGVALKGAPEQWLALRLAVNSRLTASAEKEDGLNLLSAELDGLFETGPPMIQNLSAAPVSTSTPAKSTSGKFGLPAFMAKKENLPKLEISLDASHGTLPLLTDDPLTVRLRDSQRKSEAGAVRMTLTYRPWRRQRASGSDEGDPSQNQIAGNKVPISWQRSVEKLVSLRRGTFRSRLVVLQVQEGLSFLPWESLSLGKVAIALQPDLALHRLTKSWQQRPIEAAGELGLLVCDPNLDELRKAFEPLVKKGLLTQVTRLDLENLATPDVLARFEQPPRLVHLIGSARLFNETPRLLLGRRRSSYVGSPGQATSPNLNPAQENGRPMALPGRDLADLFKAARLVIIQGQPVDQAGWSSDSGYQAAFLRVMAEDMFKAGVPAVLAIPPLTFNEAQRFISNLTKRLIEIDWRQNGETGLVEAVSEARRDLAKQSEPSVRPALDICLYADIGPRGILFD